MSIPIVAIIGRPNVGKSTIFNRMVRKRLAIVDKESGVTRDRKYQETEWSGYSFIAVDTGGMVPNSFDEMEQLIQLQVEIAIQEADIIIFVLDCKTVITTTDEQITKKLFPILDKVIFVLNKVDNQKDELYLFDFLNLGLGEPIGISAISGRNFGELLDNVVEKIPPGKSEYDILNKESIKIAVVGKQNVGKSSLVNKIIGQNAVIVTEIPGTTRDSIHLNFNYKERPMTIIDTAGLRKKSKVKFGIEYFSNLRSLRSINSSDIVLVLLDAQEEISLQDKRIVEYTQSQYKDIIIVVNKWDLIAKENDTTSKYIQKIREEMGFINYAPIIFISALTGKRVNKLLELILYVEEQSNLRIPTSKLNQFFQSVFQKYAPHHPSKKNVKFYYCTEANVHPPTFVFSVNNPKLITENYKRYIHNQIREIYKFEGVTLRFKYKGRKN
ncbi:MAG: ribosome biogenesis GTPase Der [Candidatus Cloacimonetes bacterium]|nr:ribosome biogenesis GTPase Der [Candidatus Cloacimonadota bacterium]MBL7085565.1 ribosome biogenesis GTPase Der [Candidatus Cloacimonadota bacterium]